MPAFEFLRREPDVRPFAAGATIFKRGDAGDSLFFVVEGTVQIEIDGQVVERLESGSVFGEMALIDHAPRSANAVAATDCRLALVNEKRFLRLVGETPLFALHLMQVITQRLRRVNPA